MCSGFEQNGTAHVHPNAITSAETCKARAYTTHCSSFAAQLQHHTQRVLAREPGGRDELAEVVAKAASERLDRSRPLWSLWVVEGLEGGQIALVIRAHHALLDGMSGAAMLLHLFDRNPEEAVVPGTRSARPSDRTHIARPPTLKLLGALAKELPNRAVGRFSAIREVGKAAVRIARNTAGVWRRFGAQVCYVYRPARRQSITTHNSP